jgi:hypothetical protein
MGGRARTLIVGLLLGLTAWGAAFARANAAAPSPSDIRQQVLVLLRLPPEHLHAEGNYAGSYGDGAGLAARRRIAGRLARTYGLTVVTGWPMPVVGVDCFVMAVPADRSPQATAALLARDAAVEWSEPMQVYAGQAKAAAVTPNDPMFRLQPAASAWRLADLHQLATGRNVRVAVIDSRIDTAHPDLVRQFATVQDFVTDRPGAPEQHGTGVAGVIAAKADNGLGIAGIAPDARLMALRACWQEPGSAATVCDTLSLAKALHFAIEHDAQVINLSLSGPPGLLLGRLLDAAMARGAIVVGAMDPNLADGGFPASHHGVVAVTDDPRTATRPDVVLAPGHDVPTTLPGGRWALVNGSSYSAAHISGLFALLRERRPHAQSLRLVAGRGVGAGVDACATLLGASGPCDGCACSQPVRSVVSARP